jgi:hypothetical protein
VLEGCSVITAFQRSPSAAKMFLGREARVHGSSAIAFSHGAMLYGKTRAELNDRQKI